MPKKGLTDEQKEAQFATWQAGEENKVAQSFRQVRD